MKKYTQVVIDGEPAKRERVKVKTPNGMSIDRAIALARKVGKIGPRKP